MAEEDIKLLTKRIVTLYDTETPTETVQDIVEKIYDSDATLTDPMFKVTGHKAIMRHFLFTRGLFNHSKIQVISVGYEQEEKQVNIQFMLQYSRKLAWLVPVNASIHNFVTLHLTDDFKIDEQTDHFDIATTIKNIPVVSFMYDIGRTVAGSMVSLSVGALQSIGGLAHGTVKS